MGTSPGAPHAPHALHAPQFLGSSLFSGLNTLLLFVFYVSKFSDSMVGCFSRAITFLCVTFIK